MKRLAEEVNGCRLWPSPVLKIFYKLQDVVQADFKEHEHVLESLEKAVQEIDEMHGLLITHKQRIPTVDTVIILCHSPAVAFAFKCSCCVSLHATCCTP